MHLALLLLLRLGALLSFGTLGGNLLETAAVHVRHAARGAPNHLVEILLVGVRIDEDAAQVMAGPGGFHVLFDVAAVAAGIGDLELDRVRGHDTPTAVGPPPWPKVAAEAFRLSAAPSDELGRRSAAAPAAATATVAAVSRGGGSGGSGGRLWRALRLLAAKRLFIAVAGHLVCVGCVGRLIQAFRKCCGAPVPRNATPVAVEGSLDGVGARDAELKERHQPRSGDLALRH
mmetsp:Transcript_51770/g.168269  ORF Transcript_51770/g.168269 Transcript_51770/m.168269 type:complete len:231 (+) Transcript_51770:1700-2392(+)